MNLKAQCVLHVAVLSAGCLLAPNCHTVLANETTKVAFVVQRDYIQNRALRKELQRYTDLVHQRFDTELILTPADAKMDPGRMRSGLQKLYGDKKIKGALLLGHFQFPVFHNECGDESTMFSYYSDLNGTIEDRNGDGKFDFYDPWLSGESANQPTQEIWLAVIKPYYLNERECRTIQEIEAYFRKVNTHLQNFENSTNNEASILTSRDWPQLDHLHRALQPIYGDRIEQRGGFDAGNRAISTTPSDLKYILKRPAEISFLYVHSGSSQHVLDAPSFPGNCILPGVLDQPGRLLLENFEDRPRILSIWGCHALDVQNVKYLNNRFLADSYLFTPRFATQTLLGSSRSIGLEQVEVLIPKLKDKCLADAWHDYLNHCYSEEFLKGWLGVRGVWEKERYGFDWGFCIYGNPFDRLGVASDVESDSLKRR